MNNLMQPLKLQFASSYKAYIINFIIIIVGCILAYSVGNNSVDSYSYLLGFEYLFTLAIGIYNIKVIGKTYYDLKHDRRLFIISSVIANLFNAVFMLLLYFIVIILTKNAILTFNIISYTLSFILIFTLANTYALFTNNLKYVNLIFIITIILLFLLFGHIAREILIDITNAFIIARQDMDLTSKLEISMIICVALVLMLNIINDLKYNKTI